MEQKLRGHLNLLKLCLESNPEHHILQNPRKKGVPSENPGVQLRKILTEKAVKVETVRISVPNTTMTHISPTKMQRLSLWDIIEETSLVSQRES